MDPATLATTITTLIAPFLAKLGASVMDQVTAELPEKVGKLWDVISKHFKGNPAASSAATDLTKNAEDKDNQQIFELQLRKALKEDLDFADALSRLLQEAEESIKKPSDNNVALARDQGIAVGKINVGGDMPGNIVIGNGNQIGDHNQSMNNS